MVYIGEKLCIIMGIFNFNVMERFVERFETKKIAVAKNLERFIECYGFKVFDNGYVAYAEENEVKVFNTSCLVVDKGLFDVFYFKTGESVKKYNNEVCWGFYDKQGNLIVKAKKVKILSDKILAVMSSDGEWKVFLLFEEFVPFLLFYSTRDCVLDVKAYEGDKTKVCVVFYSPEEVEIQSVNLLSYKSSVSILARSYMRISDGMFAVSCRDVFDVVARGKNFLEVKSKNGEVFDIFDDDLRLKYKDVDSIIWLKNGHYFLNAKGEYKLFSKMGKEIAHFRKVKVFDYGEIYASFEEGRGLVLVGRYVDENLLLLIDDKVIISDGKKVRLTEKNDLADFIFVM